MTTEPEANHASDQILGAKEALLTHVWVRRTAKEREFADPVTQNRAGGTAGGIADVSTSTGAAMAIVHLPTIDEVRPVNEGVELSVLNRGVLGDHPDSAAPGDVGNFAVAGHRTTYGRPLWDIAELSLGDPIVVETPTAYFGYRLSELRIVQPYQSEVVAPVPGRPGEQPKQRWMVMTACHPKFSASQRIVAISVLEHAQPGRPGRPPR